MTESHSTGIRIPYFVGIGGQRCGSSWLYWNLREHPQLGMSSKKEADFFSRPINEARILEYNSYFSNCDRIAGDVSPSYSAMYADEVCLARDLAPDLKIIFVVRNPVDRLISQVTRSLTFDKSREPVSLLKLLRQVDSGLAVRLTDYQSTYRRWQNCFGQANILLEKYDTLGREPEFFMEKVLRFLGVDETLAFAEQTFHRRKNKSSQVAKDKIPELLRWYLAWRWLPQVRAMDRELPLDLSEWISCMERDVAAARWYYPLVAAVHTLYFYWPHQVVYTVVSYIRMKIRVARSRRNIAAFLGRTQIAGGGEPF